MRILVCIKQVPQSTARMDEGSGVIIRSQGERVMNPHDESALELALRLGGTDGTVELLSMGPQFAREMLASALEVGASKAYLLCGAAFAGADVLATSRALAEGILHIGLPDIVVCGEYTTDGGTGHTGAALAARLGIDCVDCVTEILEQREGRLLLRHRREDEGREYTVECKTPLLLTAKSGAFPLRLPSLKLKLAAKKKEIALISPEQLSAGPESFGLSGSRTRVRKIETVAAPATHPPARSSGAEAAKIILAAVRRLGDE